jgi:hypothetical protein
VLIASELVLVFFVLPFLAGIGGGLAFLLADMLLAGLRRWINRKRDK